MKAGDTSGDALPRLAEVKTDEEQTMPSTRLWQRMAFGALVLISAFLNFFQISQVGYGNAYYAAAVKSMLHSWHAFFFVSFDSGGFVSVDKPPLGFWLQAASAKIFGFSGWSLLLPEAIAGIFSVMVLYLLVRRIWGLLAGLLAALALALSPVSSEPGLSYQNARSVPGYNGLDRLLGDKGASSDNATSRSTSSSATENGLPGIFRLFNQQVRCASFCCQV